MGDPLADEIYRALLEEPTGLTRSGIRDLFNRNRSSKDIGHALQSLAATGRVNVERRHERGRPAEIWRDLASTSQLIPVSLVYQRGLQRCGIGPSPSPS